MNQTHRASEWTENRGGHEARLWFPIITEPVMIMDGQVHPIGLCWIWKCVNCGKSWPYGHDDVACVATTCGFIDEGKCI